MAQMDIALKDMMQLDGAIGATVVDYGSGMPLRMLSGSKALDIEIAAAGHTELIRAEMRTIEQLVITVILQAFARTYPLSVDPTAASPCQRCRHTLIPACDSMFFTGVQPCRLRGEWEVPELALVLAEVLMGAQWTGSGGGQVLGLGRDR